jgi:hypothetical protein
VQEFFASNDIYDNEMAFDCPSSHFRVLGIRKMLYETRFHLLHWANA